MPAHCCCSSTAAWPACSCRATIADWMLGWTLAGSCSWPSRHDRSSEASGSCSERQTTPLHCKYVPRLTCSATSTHSCTTCAYIIEAQISNRQCMQTKTMWGSGVCGTDYSLALTHNQLPKLALCGSLHSCAYCHFKGTRSLPCYFWIQ